MATELFIVAIYFLFCLMASPKTIISSIFLLLPLHGFVKFALFTDSGTIFTLWKEVGIIIAYIKMYQKRSKYTKLNCAVAFFYVFIFIYLIIGHINQLSVGGDVRRFIFPILLLYLVSKIDYNEFDIKMLVISIFIGASVINITGIVDFMSPSIRVAMRYIMGVEFQIATDGSVYYDISSYKIMGLDRVCGLMGGGPNMMGVFNAAIFIMIAYAYVRKLFIGRIEKLFFYVSSLLCIFCLILSFSRAGWALVIITFFYMSIMNKRYRKIGIFIMFCAFMFGTIFYFSIDSVQTVIDGTFSGNEASSAERSNMTYSSLKFLISNPFGYGLGATDRVNENYVYFAESTMINLGISMSVLGILLYSTTLYAIFEMNRHNKSNPFYLIVPGFIIAYYITSWVSVNVVENPFVYYAWLIMGLGMNKHLHSQHIPLM